MSEKNKEPMAPIEKSNSPVLPMEGIVDTLNDLLKLDQAACRELFACRVKVNADIYNHATFQTGGTEAKPTLSVLGFLNGLLEPTTGRRVAGLYDNDELIGFQIYQPPKINS